MRISPLLLVCALSSGAIDPASAQTRQVVVIYDERLDFPGLAALDASLVRTLTKGESPAPEIYRQSLDLSRFGSREYLSHMRDHLRAKYADRKIDVAIAVMGPSLDFLLEYGSEIFPGTPIIFCGIDRRQLARRKLPGHVTGVLVERRFRPTLELALRLHPDTRRVVVVGGTSAFDRALLDETRQELRIFERRVAITDLAGLPMQELTDTLASLPPKTIVLYTTLMKDGAGQPFVPHDALRAVVAAANVPVYGFVDQYLGLGIVGGHLYSINAHGELAALLARRVLAGEPPASVPIVESATSRDVVDWRQVERWRIRPALLPPGVAIRFREPSAWDQYRWYVVAAIALTVLQASIIITLIVERSLRRQSQHRYALASANGGVGVWDWNLETNEMYIDPFLKVTLGYKDHEIRNHIDDWSRLVLPEDASLVAQCARDAIEGRSASFEVEHRMVHRDGSIRWFLVRGSVVRKNGKGARMTGTDTHITDRKHAEQALDFAQNELTRVSRLTSLGEFAASVAHEVRQPLTSIVLNVEACLHWLHGASPDLDKIREALDDVMAASNRADEVIQRNRELFRMHSVSKELLDMNAVIRAVALLAGPRLHKSHMRLTTSLTSDLPAVMGDRIELEQVLLNLIANSIDATEQLPPGKRKVAIRSALTADGSVQVSVSDNGVGLDEVDRDQLFTLSYTTKASGTGVGLSLCRSIIEAHGGQLFVAPTPGPGATFCFTIPLAAREAVPAVPPLVHA